MTFVKRGAILWPSLTPDPMTNRQLMAKVLKHAGCSPERFAEDHGEWCMYYSGRQLRRFLAGHPMPLPLYHALKRYLAREASPNPKE